MNDDWSLVSGGGSSVSSSWSVLAPPSTVYAPSQDDGVLASAACSDDDGHIPGPVATTDERWDDHEQHDLAAGGDGTSSVWSNITRGSAKSADVSSSAWSHVQSPEALPVASASCATFQTDVDGADDHEEADFNDAVSIADSVAISELTEGESEWEFGCDAADDELSVSCTSTTPDDRQQWCNDRAYVTTSQTIDTASTGRVTGWATSQCTGISSDMSISTRNGYPRVSPMAHNAPAVTPQAEHAGSTYKVALVTGGGGLHGPKALMLRVNKKPLVRPLAARTLDPATLRKQDTDHLPQGEQQHHDRQHSRLADGRLVVNCTRRRDRVGSRGPQARPPRLGTGRMRRSVGSWAVGCAAPLGPIAEWDEEDGSGEWESESSDEYADDNEVGSQEAGHTRVW